MTDFEFTPVIIIGAARSGTNMLRDALTAMEGFDTWPCDEINPIWRHGNINWPNDAIPPERASRPRAHIRRAFMRIWRETGKPRFVVEKTCANSLRVPFVNAVLPEAKYIHIFRDGVDVVASAQKRWRGEMELPSIPYYWAKIRYAPWSDLPRYGLSFVSNRIAMVRSPEKRMSVWGPRFEGMGEIDASLDAICATQWVRCVEAANSTLALMPKDKVFILRYEDMTINPVCTLSMVLDFLGVARPPEEVARAVSDVSKRSVGKGHKELGGDVELLMNIIRPTLERLGYEE